MINRDPELMVKIADTNLKKLNAGRMPFIGKSEHANANFNKG
jgi:hypothetical protein